MRRLQADVFLILGSRPVADVTASQLLAMTKRMESLGALDIAKRSLQTCGQIMRYAVAHGVIERNPSDALRPRRKENHARLNARDVPELLRKIETYQGGSYTRLAMKLMAYTFVRTGGTDRRAMGRVRSGELRMANSSCTHENADASYRATGASVDRGRASTANATHRPVSAVPART